MKGILQGTRALTNRLGERGQDLVEFALVLPLILSLLLGICEFGLLVSKYSTVANASREGARFGITHPDYANSGACSSGLDGVVGATCNLAGRLTPSQVLVTTTTGTSAAGPTITVKVTYTTSLLTGWIIQTLGGESDVTMSASSTMQFEQTS